MHESERHRVILAAVQTRSVATVADLVDLTGASEATIRRDISGLHLMNRLRRVRGGAEAVNPPAQSALVGRTYTVNESLKTAEKRAIAKAAANLCKDGEAIILNGGTTVFQMVHHLINRRLQVFTNSFPIAEHLIHHSKNTVTVQGGTIYREHNIILSPFENDVSRNFHARKMFMSAKGLGAHGLTEADPLLIQAELKLISQADELIVLLDSSKFLDRSSLVLCGLDRIATVVTDSGIRTEDKKMLADAGVKLIVAERVADVTISVA